jgi:hypothetical protein
LTGPLKTVKDEKRTLFLIQPQKLKAGALKALTQQLSAYGVKIAVIQETRRTGEETRDTMSLVGKSKEAAVAFIVDASIRGKILKFTPRDGG